MSKKKRDVYCADDLVISQNAHRKFKRDKKSGDQLAVFAVMFNRLLEEKKIDQKKLAADLNISAGLISNYRNGKTDPCLTKIINIAKYLNVDCTYLMTGISTTNSTLADDTGLSENAIETLKLINKEGHSEEKRTITMINRALDYAPADRIKDMPLSPIFILLDQYITSGDVKRKLHREYVQDLDDSPAKVQREREADNKASTYVVAESGKGLQKIDFENLYREAKLAEIRKGLDRLLKEENEKEKPKEKKLPC